MSRWAVLVEDDEEQIYFTTSILEQAGFQVVTYECAEVCLTHIDSVDRPIDLVVLDRRLPRLPTDEPSDGVGDELLDALVAKLPDSPFVVFTGHTGVPHLQFATQERGVIDVGDLTGLGSLDRVRAFEKEQSVEFEQYVQRIADLIDGLSDIETTGLPDGDDHLIDRRLLRRVARHYGGSSIRVAPLAGGLTDAPVWRCEVLGPEGGVLASVVVKRSTSSSPSPKPGGLHSILPGSNVAAAVAVITGLCDGYRAQVMQVAGREPESLLAVLGEDEVRAARQLKLFAKLMEPLRAQRSPTTLAISDLAAPLGDWDALGERLASVQVEPPRGSMQASTRLLAQHGDLHPGNILVIDERPVMIDFDSEVTASCALDAVTMLLSPLFHKDSPLRERDWPTPAQCQAIDKPEFLDDCPAHTWMSNAWEWFIESSCSPRERWTLILAYAGRQLKYPDVKNEPAVKARAVALAKAAAEYLRQV